MHVCNRMNSVVCLIDYSFCFNINNMLLEVGFSEEINPDLLQSIKV